MKKTTSILLLFLLMLVGCTTTPNTPDNSNIIIEGLKNEYSLNVGDEFDPLKNITATKDGIDVTNNLNWFGDIPLDEKGKLTTSGTYEYSVMYLEGGNVLKEINVTLTVININEKYDIKPVIEIAKEFNKLDKVTSGDGYTIVWSDEFDTDGAPNSEYWSYEIGNGDWGWGNGEKQYYTNRSDNVKVKDGKLIITAKRENYNNFNYTSTRIVSRKKVDIKYGRVEFLAKLPKGGGTWPALWMMPTDSRYGTWPASGEIDVMEHVGNNQDAILGTCHSSAYNGGEGRGTTIKANAVSDTFNLYGLEWTPDGISFLLNDKVYYTYKNPKYSNNNYKYYPYDQEFFIIMNIAMGGMLGGNIDPNFTSSSMEVEYVRVYQKDYTNSDIEAPKKVNVTAKKSTNEINLSWTKATDNVGLKHYEVFVNGNSLDATIKTNYTIKNIDPNKEYEIQVVAVDLAGNYSVSDIAKIQQTNTKMINTELIIIKKEENFAF